MKINLSVLAQSSPYIADVAPAPSTSRKSFAARMSVSEAFQARDRDSLQGDGVPGSGGGGSAMILANHCAWFVVDSKKSKTDGSGSSSSASKALLVGGGGGGNGKDNSVVRLLSSENVRMDIDEAQLKVGIKMIKNGV